MLLFRVVRYAMSEIKTLIDVRERRERERIRSKRKRRHEKHTFLSIFMKAKPSRALIRHIRSLFLTSLCSLVSRSQYDMHIYFVCLNEQL